VGSGVGSGDGIDVGCGVGSGVGSGDGIDVGCGVGSGVGSGDGIEVGCGVGSGVGSCDANRYRSWFSTRRLSASGDEGCFISSGDWAMKSTMLLFGTPLEEIGPPRENRAKSDTAGRSAMILRRAGELLFSALLILKEVR
jgi:hypothetical protein